MSTEESKQNTELSIAQAIKPVGHCTTDRASECLSPVNNLKENIMNLEITNPEQSNCISDLESTAEDLGEGCSEPVEYPFHPVSAIFPLLDEKELDELKADIRDSGLREPIWWFENLIFDGRNRYMACSELGIEPGRREWNGKGSLLDFVLSLNLKRRHLNERQRAMSAARALPFFEQDAKHRQMEAGKNFGRGKDSANLREPIDRPRKASEDAAQMFDVSSRSVESAKTVLTKGISELSNAVDTGKIAVSTAAAIAEVPQEKQLEILKLDEAKAIGRAAREIAGTKKASPIRSKTVTS